MCLDLEPGCRARQNVEHHEFLFREALSDVAFLFFVQTTAQRQEFLEEFFDVPAAYVVGFDQLFEFRQIVGPGPVQANELV